MQWNEFLTHGCFLGIPSQEKVYVMALPQKSDQFLFDKPCFYKNNFFLDDAFPWLIGDDFFEFTFIDFKNEIKNYFSKKPILNWNPLHKKNYIKQFDSLMSLIQNGVLQKGVPFIHQECNFEIKLEHLVYFLNEVFLLNKDINMFYYGCWNLNEKSGFIGVTPELLFTKNGNRIDTCALAGTVSNSSKSKIIDEKILKEHLFVAEALEKNLNTFGIVKADKCHLVKLKNFSHLKTDIHLDLNAPFSFEDILSAIHPSPALGTFPKQEGLAWLRTVESQMLKKYDYCSPFGLYLNEHYSLCVGTIRCLQWNKNIVRVSAGGGVIRESALEKEWEEIQIKIQAIKNYFNI